MLRVTWVIIEYILVQWCWIQATGKSNYIDAWIKSVIKKMAKWSREKGRPNHKIEKECLFEIILVLIIILSWNRTWKVYCLLFNNAVIGMYVTLDKKMTLSPGYACETSYIFVSNHILKQFTCWY